MNRYPQSLRSAVSFGHCAAICAAIILANVFTAFSGTATAETFAWTQYGPRGLEARATTDAATCPTAVIDGRPQKMAVRAAPGEGYPVTACAVAIPRTARAVTVDGRPVGVPARNPKRIAVVGDTGCRLKGSYTQGCNDPAQWPFAQIAAQIAKHKPDLIIHVGDYHYRETPCPESVPACAGSPHGDNWPAWRADFFVPAAPLLPLATWVVVRGNHEDCERGGKGWSRILEPTAFDANAGCNGGSAPYAVKLPRLTLAVLDVVLAPEEKFNPAQVETFKSQYASLNTIGRGPIWLLQHRPIWGAGGSVAGLPYGDNKTLAAAARDSLPKRLQIMLTGHHHLFQVLSYREDLPAQITVGHGGDYLNAGRSSDPAGMVINGVTVDNGLNELGQFGYVIFEPAKVSWAITNYDTNGRALHHCGLKNRKASCMKAIPQQP